MTDRTNNLFLIVCYIAIFLNLQSWILGFSIPLKVLTSFVSNSIIVLTALYFKSQDNKKE